MTVKDFLFKLELSTELSSNNEYDKKSYLDYGTKFLTDIQEKDMHTLSEKQRKFLIDIVIYFTDSPLMKRPVK